jgi:hypothetical protein
MAVQSRAALSGAPTAAIDITASSAAPMALTAADGSTIGGSCGSANTGVGVVVWGDGTTSVATVTSGGSTALGTHTYVVPGIYTVAYCVRDTYGKQRCADQETWSVPDLATSVCAITGTACIDGDTVGDGCGDVATCDDPAYGDEYWCEYDGTCSDVQYTYRSTCEGASETWTSTNTWTTGEDTAIRNADLRVNKYGTGTMVKHGKTGQDGTFRIDATTAGNYDIIASKNGFEFTHITNLTVDCASDPQAVGDITGDEVD